MNKYKWMVFIILLGIFFLVLGLTEKIHFHIGKEEEIYEPSYFTSEITGTLLISPYGVEKELLNILATTRYTLRMWNYLLTEKTFLSMFSNLGQMGKKVNIILENKVYGGDSDAFNQVKKKLEKNNISVISDEQMGTNFVHAKTIVIDNDTFIIATANFTYPSLWRNREYRFIGGNKNIIHSLISIFDKDIKGEKIYKKDIDKHLFVCPINCREVLEYYLESARKSILIETQYIQDEHIVNILKKQKFHGVNVQLLVGKYQDQGWLESFGTGFKILEDPYIHAKNILIDEEILLMGSANLSDNALDNNREIGIIIDDLKIIKQFEKQFERDWSIK